MPARIDLTGHRYGRLSVLSFFEKKTTHRYWLCRCDCGNEKTVSLNELRSGGTQSCGCLLKEKITKHGKSDKSIYTIYRQMMARCHKESNQAYKYYGFRGITVCEHWRKGFIFFYQDMGDRPSKRHTLDRIDNNKGYSKENCRWVPMSLQSYNKSYKQRSMPMGVNEKKTKSGIKYFSYITVKRKRIYLGCFETKELAHEAFSKRRSEALKAVELDFENTNLNT